jgi:hypothetical protein
VIGIGLYLEYFNYLQDVEDLIPYLNLGFRQGGWLICLGGFFVLIPIILLIITITRRKGKKALEPLESSGTSKDDPMPPTS